MLHDILKDFKGSQDGRFATQFKAGTQAELSDSLAAVAVKEGWARRAKPAQPRLDIDNKAVATDGSTAQMKRGKAK